MHCWSSSFDRRLCKCIPFSKQNLLTDLELRPFLSGNLSFSNKLTSECVFRWVITGSFMYSALKSFIFGKAIRDKYEFPASSSFLTRKLRACARASYRYDVIQNDSGRLGLVISLKTRSHLSHLIKRESLMFSLTQYCLDFLILTTKDSKFHFSPTFTSNLFFWTRNKNDICLKHITSSTLIAWSFQT